ncbi:MBL fold metallo-hydrolase [Parageobacillus sp. VR-IP]|uniref:MBL fold metallo-hydrolase n=1 Tax=Parageobacillus sp. VR-IP TaxID=2742205 RepID=UPI0015834B78|nr:MBL fold metallo-hydrolase [Parageobacillus sp. VR-IP]NUK30262.1 MBL fold metallo-hydrolase [Parageobacillus sp. VR-IP]
MKQISENLFLYEDTCNVYVVKNGHSAVLIDFGSGDVLDELAAIGVKRVTDVLLTHHHRDQCQGLERANHEGINIWVPHMEQDLFQEVDTHWQAREIDNNYNMRQDRFSLLWPVTITGTLTDYSTRVFNQQLFTIIPTPGHTVGSISIITELDGKKIAFTGDLIAGPGKVWSLSATQWTYNGGEGIALTVLSLLDLQEREIDLLLPSHGVVIDEPDFAINLLIERLRELMKRRKQNPRLFELREKPYETITPHLLKNRTSLSNSYVLISSSRKALMIDFGYDFVGGVAAGADRASRRPWLYTISALKRDFHVDSIDVVIPTHFHDDHVAGFNLLKSVENTQVWCPENFSDILENPQSYDLPCLWYDPISVDRKLPLHQAIQWEEYELTLYEQPGHTLYAVAIQFEVDGKKMLAVGDQYQGTDYNYVYHNGFRIWDYRASARLYKNIRPDILLFGHCDPIYVTDEYLDIITENGEALERLHQELLPLETIDFGAEGFGATIKPYQIFVEEGGTFSIEVEIKNPFQEEEEAIVNVVVPNKWKVRNGKMKVGISGKGTAKVKTEITVPPRMKIRRERIAVDLTIGKKRFGQHAEALVTIK